MKRKHTFILALGLLLIPFSAVLISNFMLVKNLRLLDNFTSLFRYTALTMAALFLLGAIWGGSSESANEKDFHPEKFLRAWWVGFILLVAIALGLALYVDPHAHFGGNSFPPITPNARAIKTELYGQLSGHPDIVILGSSRAFTISPAYIEEKTGYNAFNMSVEGGKMGDYAAQLNFILKSEIAPRVLAVDMNIEILSATVYYLELQPVALIPYMPASMALTVGEKILQDVASVQSLSDSLYLLTLPNLRERPRTWVFQDNGMGNRRQITHEQYLELLASSIEPRINTMQCKGFEPSSAMAMLEDIIRRARENNIAILLYESPIHIEFYQAAYEDDPQAFNACRDLFGSYLQSLAETHSNVFLADLSRYEPVIGLGEEGYYDGIHLRPNAAQLVVDALVPTIEDAITWSLQESAK